MAENNLREEVLSPVSSADSKKSKLSITDERVFERLSVTSIQYFAESLGYDTHFRKFANIISSDALCALTEDVNYHLRELANNASLFMRQRRGNRLNVSDINKALYWLGVQNLRGHRSREPPRLHFLKELNLFVPNEGVVDAPTLALAKPTTSASLTATVTGKLFSINDHLKEEAVELGALDLRDTCLKVLQKCISCPLKDFSKSLVALRQASCIDKRSGVMLLSHATALMKRAPSNYRIWRCLFQLLNYADYGGSVEAMNLLNQLSITLTELVLRGNINMELNSDLFTLQCRLLTVVSRKYDYFSTSSFDLAILQKLSASTIHMTRILQALYLTLDVRLLLSHMDLLVGCFDHFVNSGIMDDLGLYFSWRTLIISILRHILCQLPKCATSLDLWLRTLLELAYEAFGDGFVIPTIIPQPDPIDVNANPNEKTFQARSTLGGHCLEEYWDTLTKSSQRMDVDDVAYGQSTLSISTSRKRKRRRISDVFEVPKRFCTLQQRDIIFVFHHTPAAVRPRVRSENEGLMTNGANIVAIDNKIEQAMDLVKTHLLYAVREEVEVLKERIVELESKIVRLESENTLLRKHAPIEIVQLIQQQQDQETMPFVVTAEMSTGVNVAGSPPKVLNVLHKLTPNPMMQQTRLHSCM